MYCILQAQRHRSSEIIVSPPISLEVLLAVSHSSISKMRQMYVKRGLKEASLVRSPQLEGYYKHRRMPFSC